MLRTRLISGPRAGVVMSAVAAALLTIISLGETLFEPLRVVPNEPAPVTLRLPSVVMRTELKDGRARLERVAPVIGRGTRVTESSVAEYVTLYEEARRPVRIGTLVGTAFIYFLMAIMMTTYLRRFSLSYGTLLRTQVGLLGVTVGFVLCAKLMLLLSDLSPYAIPVAALPLWISLFLDRRTAFMVGMAASFLCASLVDFRLDYLLTYLACSFTVTLAMRARHRAADILLAGAAAAIAGAALVIAGTMLLRGGISLRGDLAALWHSNLISGLVGGFLAGVLGLMFQSAIGRVLGAASRAKLIDLSDLSLPLLQKMAREAPGSWEHARAMANLAEAAASAIGADGLLTRETAILMLVDAIEAASRTVEHERDKFEEMVNRIFFVKLKQGQLDESGLSLEDLRIMSKRLTDTLCKMHHSRIRYPWQDAQATGQAALPIPDARSDDAVHKGVEEALEVRAGH